MKHGDWLHKNLQSGDYWKLLNKDGTPVISDEPGNLTHGVWMMYLDGIGCFKLTKHTVREHEDGTISVLPGDGSSNSIGVRGAHGKYWHGYIYNGVWKEA